MRIHDRKDQDFKQTREEKQEAILRLPPHRTTPRARRRLIGPEQVGIHTRKDRKKETFLSEGDSRECWERKKGFLHPILTSSAAWGFARACVVWLLLDDFLAAIANPREEASKQAKRRWRGERERRRPTWEFKEATSIVCFRVSTRLLSLCGYSQRSVWLSCIQYTWHWHYPETARKHAPRETHFVAPVVFILFGILLFYLSKLSCENFGCGLNGPLECVLSNLF